MNRRQFIERTGLGIGALGPPLLLEACGQAAPSSGAPAVSAGGDAKSSGVFPTYSPFPNKPTPDYPSSGDPYLDGYDNFPKSPVRAVSGDVGQGSTVTSMTIGLFPPPDAV